MIEAETTSESTGRTTKDKEFVFLREKKGEGYNTCLKQFEFILQDDFGEPRLDPQRKKIVVIGPSPNDLVSKVFLTKSDERGNMERARVVELINEFGNKLDRDPLRCKYKILFEKNTAASKDTHLDNIMSYNDIFGYVERKNNNKDGNY